MSATKPRVRRLSASAHGALDYALIAVFALAPAVFSSGTPRAAALACYGFVALLCFLSLFTRYPLGIVPAIPAAAHGLVELLLGPLLIALPWLAGFSGFAVARSLFIAAGAVVLLGWLVTDYQSAREWDAPHEPPIDRGATPPHQGP